MDLTELINTVGLWPALVIFLAYLYDRVQRERLAEKDKRIGELEAESHKTIEAQHRERDEWKRLAMGRIGIGGEASS